MKPDGNGQAAPGRHVQPTADVDEQAEIGEGSWVWHLAQIRENARMGVAASSGEVPTSVRAS